MARAGPRVALLAAAACLAAGCAAATVSSAGQPAAPAMTASAPPASAVAGGPALKRVPDSGHVTGTLHGPCHTSGGGQLPDPDCTPGAIDPSVGPADLCVPERASGGGTIYVLAAWWARLRAPFPETTHAKYDVVEPAYGQHGVPGELDHLVPRELAGANDLANLWVERGPVPNAKDRVEWALHDWVCAATGAEARHRLAAAQHAIARDWTTAKRKLGITRAGPAP